MKFSKLVRLTVQAAAFAIFVYQMVEAVDKFITFRTVPIEETKDISKTKLPTLMICKQFNYTKAAESMGKQGYYDQTDFLAGYLLDLGFVSWEGLHNITYSNITETIFDPIYSLENLAITKYNDYGVQDIQNMAVHFTAYDGYCGKLDLETLNATQSKSYIFNIMSYTTEDFDLRIVDLDATPFYKINLDSMKGDILKAEFGKTSVYTITIEEVHRMEESGKCTSYGDGAEFRTYADCIANKQKNIFQPILGCMIPWMAAPNDLDTCIGRIDVAEESLYWDFMSDLLEKIIFYDVTQLYDSCLNPCLEHNFHSKQKIVLGSNATRKITLNFRETVRVIKHVKAYGFFDLVVEVGSCLGLWIGLSALGVFDLFLEFGKNMKRQI